MSSLGTRPQLTSHCVVQDRALGERSLGRKLRLVQSGTRVSAATGVIYILRLSRTGDELKSPKLVGELYRILSTQLSEYLTGQENAKIRMNEIDATLVD